MIDISNKIKFHPDASDPAVGQFKADRTASLHFDYGWPFEGHLKRITSGK